MTKLRVGDKVLIEATVTAVVPFDDQQQIMVHFEPKGETDFGWLCPHEYTFKLSEQKIIVGDKVWVDRAQSLRGTVEAIAPAKEGNPPFAWVKPDGRHDYRTVPVSELRR